MAPSLTIGRAADTASPSESSAAGGGTILYLPASSRDRSGVCDRLTRTGATVVPVADITEALQLLASRRHTLCVVDLADDRAALGAEVDAAGEAVHTVSARREVGLARDAGAQPGLVDAVADLDDRPGHLVPHRHGRDGLVLAVGDVQVGPADAGADDVEQHMAWIRTWLGPLAQADAARAGRELGQPDHSEPDTRA